MSLLDDKVDLGSLIDAVNEEEAARSVSMEQDFPDAQPLLPTVSTINDDASELMRIAELLKYTDTPTQLHSKILSRLIRRRNLAREALSSKFDMWDEIDNNLRARIDLSAPARTSDGGTDPRYKEMPYSRSVVVPMMFSILSVRHSQQLSVFLSRTPVFQIEGVGPEDVEPAKLLESVLAYDCERTNIAFAIHQILWDLERYGVGVWYVTFSREYGPIFMRTGEVEYGLRNEYNKIVPVNPRAFYLDPRFPVARLQEAEYVGHMWSAGISYLREQAIERGGPYINVEAAKRVASSRGENRRGSIEFKQSGPGVIDEHDPGVLDLYHMQIRIVPKEWGLSESENSEIWWFTWANDAVIVRAHRSPYAHGKFTYAAAEAVPDYHSIDNPGWAELILGLQRLANWMYNTHVEAVRKSLNNAFIFSPDLIVEEDVLNPNPAGHIRMTKFARDLIVSGRISPQALVYQLQHADLTRGHVNDVMTLMEFAQRLSAANDPSQGIPLPSRRTLGELQTIMASASQRIASSARICDVMALKEAVEQMIVNRQQFTTLERWYRLVGANPKDFAGRASDRLVVTENTVRALINADDIYGMFDYIGHSGSIRADSSKDPETWARALQMVSNLLPMMMNPQLYPDGRVFDVRQLLVEMAKTLGIKNIEDLFIQVQPPQPQGQPGGAPGQQFGGGVPTEMQQPPEAAPPGIQVSPQVVPQEEYTRGVESGRYVSPEELL